MAKGSITDVPGIRVGHAVGPDERSGCTVVLGPFRGAVEVTGLATGSRELGVLRPHHIAPQVNAVLLAGGSAYGLAAADGVMAWLAERGQGFEVGSTVVPLVPTAVIYDLQEGVQRPDAEMGRKACDAASNGPIAQGRVGAGAGATVGKVGGDARSMPGGLGSAVIEIGPWKVGSLAVVNAFGDVLDEWGSILAGARGDDGVFLNTSRVFRETMNRLAPSGGGSSGEGAAAQKPAVPAASAASATPGANTTLTVVATDAPLSRVDLERVARVAANGVARRIAPVNTPFDGDITFVLSTAPKPGALPDFVVTGLGTTAADCLEIAIERAVLEGRANQGSAG